MPQQTAIDGVWIFAGLDHELVEAGCACKQQLALPAELFDRVRGLGQILFGKLLQPDFAVDRHKDIDHQRHQRLIGANIRRRLLPPDVLLSRRQRQHETALSLLVRRLTHQPAGHLPYKFLSGGNHPAVRTAKSHRHTERLCFHGNDVSVPRRLDNSQR